jgi:hypothetical protein
MIFIPNAYRLYLWESQTGTLIIPYSRTTYRNLKQKEEEEKRVHLCSNRLLVCNLPHEEEP